MDTKQSKEPVPSGMKCCITCGEVKGLDGFHRNRRKPDGRQSQCRSCQAVYDRSYRKDNPEKVRAVEKAWREAHPDRVRVWQKAQRKRDTVKIRARQKAWCKTNQEKDRARKRAWNKANPEKVRASRKRRRALKAGALSVRITPMMIATMYENQDGLCYYGGEQLNGSYDLDHKIPISRGGSHTPDNVVLACATCNRRKHTKTDIEFLAGG